MFLISMIAIHTLEKHGQYIYEHKTKIFYDVFNFRDTKTYIGETGTLPSCTYLNAKPMYHDVA